MAVKVGERNVPDTPQNRQLDAAWHAMELADYTLKICTNENIFLPEYRDFLTNDIVQLAKDIYFDVWKANNIRVEGKRKEELYAWRERLQRQAVLNCKALLAHISLARRVFHLKGKRVNYWSGMVIETRNYINKWREGDRERYS